MDAIEKRARELLIAQYKARGDLVAAFNIERGGLSSFYAAEIAAIVAALTPPEGHVVVTRNEAGQAMAVTRQDDEGRILSVIAEFEAPDGYMLVPVEPTEAMLNSGLFGLEPMLHVSDIRAIYDDILAARPEVP